MKSAGSNCVSRTTRRIASDTRKRRLRWVGNDIRAPSYRHGRSLLYSSEYHYMDSSISAADANRKFSEVLQSVKKGRSVSVTSHGRPVAKIVPATKEGRAVENARSALFARLKKQRATNIGPRTRAE